VPAARRNQLEPGNETHRPPREARQKECDMLTTAPQSSDTKNWKDIYVRALREGDEDRVPSLIVEAERAIVERARELFQASGDNIEKGKLWTMRSTPFRREKLPGNTRALCRSSLRKNLFAANLF